MRQTIFLVSVLLLALTLASACAQALERTTSVVPSGAVSRSEVDAIRERIVQFWNPPLGVPNAENLSVELRVWLDPDGNVRDVRVIDQRRYRSDAMFRDAADSAVRAVRRAAPLPIPAGKYEAFRDLVLEFDPRLGQR